jgi:serine/threonine-protein kinase
MSDAMPPLVPAVPVPETLPEAAPAGTQVQDAGAQKRARELSQQKLVSGPQVPGFALRGKLGEGGMGIVYEAEQLALKRTVALKLIRHGGHASAELLARFRGEAEAVARLQHPNVVQVYEVGEREGLPYFAMEYVAGGSLDRKLAGTPLPPKEAAALVEPLARAMDAAHQKGVIHRDLKPGNVLLAEDGTPKIADFGLAKRLDDAGLKTASGVVMGTPSYMAPEQAQGKAVGPLADVYALGAILYECLTGRPPFKGATTMETLMQVVGNEPVPPRQLNPQVPRDLEAICLECLAKDARQRYATARALANDLSRFLEGHVPLARSLSLSHWVVRWCNHPHRIRDVGYLSMSMMVIVAAWLVFGVAVHAVSALQRGSRWPLENSRMPTKVELAIIQFVGVVGSLFFPLFLAGWGAIRGRAAALWAGLGFSLIDLCMVGACLFGIESFLEVADPAGLCANLPIRFFAFSFPAIIFVMMTVAYLVALSAFYNGKLA